MKLLHTIRRILALAVAIWTLAVVAYFLLFAKTSFQNVTVSANQGEPPVTTRNSGQTAWLSEAEPFSIVAMLALSLLLAASAVAGWRGALAVVAPFSLTALAATYITGFSIGGLFFPGAVGTFLCTAVLLIEKLSKRLNPPAA
jgi:hypothetical protein